MNKKEFSKAVQRYLNNGWEIYSTITNNEEITIEFAQFEGIEMIKTLELSSQKGVRIKNTNTNWNYTEWNTYNNLTACL